MMHPAKISMAEPQHGKQRERNPCIQKRSRPGEASFCSSPPPDIALVCL